MMKESVTLHTIIKNGNTALLMDKLKESFYDPSNKNPAVDAQDDDGNTAAHLIAMYPGPEQMRLLFALSAAGPNLSIKNTQGLTPIGLARKQNISEDKLQFFIKAEFLCAIANNHANEVKNFLDHENIDVNFCFPILYRDQAINNYNVVLVSPIRVAAAYIRINLLALLLQSGCYKLYDTSLFIAKAKDSARQNFYDSSMAQMLKDKKKFDSHYCKNVKYERVWFPRGGLSMNTNGPIFSGLKIREGLYADIYDEGRIIRFEEERYKKDSLSVGTLTENQTHTLSSQLTKDLNPKQNLDKEQNKNSTFAGLKPGFLLKGL